MINIYIAIDLILIYKEFYDIKPAKSRLNVFAARLSITRVIQELNF